MNKRTATFTFEKFRTLGIILVATFFGLSLYLTSYTETDAARAIGVQMRDYGCSGGSGSARYAGTDRWTRFAGDSNYYDPDCIRVYIRRAVDADRDVRMCLQFADDGASSQRGTKRCTPWLSDGGGRSGWASDRNRYDPDSSRIYLDTRKMPRNRQIKNYKLGVQMSDKGCRSQRGRMRFTPWYSSGGGWSNWATDSNGDDPDCARLYLVGNVTKRTYGSIYRTRDCRIAPNNRSCRGYFRWRTGGGVSWQDTSYIYDDSRNRVVSYRSRGSHRPALREGRHRFRLINYNRLGIGYSTLDSERLTAHCALGTRWTGGRCRRYSDNRLIYRAPDCRIQANRRTCTSRIYWRAYGHRSGDTTYLYDDTRRKVLSWRWRGAVNASVPYGTHRFRLMNYNRELGYDTMARQYVRARCAAGTYRSGSYCRPYNAAQLLTTTNCTIPAGGSTCTTRINWNARNYQSGDYPYVYDYTRRSVVPGTRNDRRGARNVTIGPGTHTFALWNYNASTGYDRLAVSRARATCASGSSWNGSECALPAPDISLVAEDDTVEYGTATRLYCDTNGFDGSCTITPGNQSCKDAWLNTGALTETTTYTYTCTASSGTYIDTNTKSATETVTVTAPEVSVSAQPSLIRRGETTTISWDPNGYDGSCTITPDDLFTNPDTIDFNTAGSAEVTQPGEVTYTYTCTDTKDNYHNNESKSDSTTVRLVPMFGEV